MFQSSFNRGVDGALIALACFAYIAAFAPRANAGPPSSQPDSPSPDPKLLPQDVVKIVVDALSKNDANDNGIRTTFKFASPSNREVTGPIDHFIPMVKSPAYAPMIGAKSAQYSDPQIQAIRPCRWSCSPPPMGQRPRTSSSFRARPMERLRGAG